MLCPMNFTESPGRSHSSDKNSMGNSLKKLLPKVAMIFCCKRFLLAVEEFWGTFSSVNEKQTKERYST